MVATVVGSKTDLLCELLQRHVWWRELEVLRRRVLHDSDDGPHDLHLSQHERCCCTLDSASKIKLFACGPVPTIVQMLSGAS